MATATARPRSQAKRAAAPAPPCFAGKLLRVDLGRRRLWAEPWAPDQMREQLGGIGLGAMLLYKETRAGRGNVSWDHPENRLVLATGPLAGLPVWGTGGLT